MAAISERPIALGAEKSAVITVSIGACLVEPRDSIEIATEMADAALYMAKGEGRNRVVILDPEAEPAERARAVRTG